MVNSSISNRSQRASPKEGEELFEQLTKHVNNRYKKMLDEAVKAEFC